MNETEFGVRHLCLQISNLKAEGTHKVEFLAMVFVNRYELCKTQQLLRTVAVYIQRPHSYKKLNLLILPHEAQS